MQRGSSIRTSEADLPGDSLLKPGDVFFREGPEEMTLEVLLSSCLETKGGNRKLGENYLHSMA